MFAQYSPLFTAGLLSDNSPSSSRSSSPNHSPRRPKKVTHDSLPVTVKSASFSLYTPHTTDENSSSAFYLTIKSSRSKRADGRSFLSLDLADTMSLRRKDTVTSRATTVFSRNEPVSPTSPVAIPPHRTTAFTHLHAPSTSSAATVIPLVSTPVLRRSSRETLRLPSPKPAPSISLPDVPTAAAPMVPASQPQNQTHRRRPSNLTITLSACFPDVGIATPTLPTASQCYYRRPAHSDPAVFSPPLITPLSADDAGASYFAFSPSEYTPPTPPPTCIRPDSLVMPMPMSAPAWTTTTPLRPSMSCRSTASYATRQRNRSAALAALEGRTGRRRAAEVKRPRNFMSMSDDEDEGEAADTDAEEPEVETRPKADKTGHRALSFLEEEVLEPRISRSLRRAFSSSPPSKRASKRASMSSTSGAKRSRRSTVESFFAPLTNFIDMRDREEDVRSSRSLRSFVKKAP